ncbi:hypothetical protein DPMN_024074 [Dreissena polymorpha]|uniref:Uncharacterized protein n=1 Tax=Dreissena polymorpha TaxID=45954 RepID=A0A9D4LQR2_DREPO|nr:hypothetical protein DPMN_024074 [Dreissena polymorpha]
MKVTRFNDTNFEFGCRSCNIANNTEADWCCLANKDCVFGDMPVAGTTVAPTTVAGNNNGGVAMFSTCVTKIATVTIITIC